MVSYPSVTHAVSQTDLFSDCQIRKHMHGDGEAGGCEDWPGAQVFLLLDFVCM